MGNSSETVEKILSELESANTLRDAGKTTEAIAIFTKYTDSPEAEIAIKANNWLGIAYLNENKHEEAEGCYAAAEDIARANGLTNQLIGITRDRAINFKNWKKFDLSEKTFLESLSLADSFLINGEGKDAILGITYNKLGLLYMDMGDLAQARLIMEQGIDLLKKSSHEYWLLIAQIDYARLLNESGESGTAKVLLDLLIPEARRQGKEYKLAEAFVAAGDSALALKDNESAHQYLRRAEDTVNSFDSELVKSRFMNEINKRLALLVVGAFIFTINSFINPTFSPQLRPPQSMIVS